MNELISLTDAGKSYIAYSEEALLAAGIAQEDIDAAKLAALRAKMVCTPRQARLALLAEGLLDDVTAWIATQDQATQVAWEFASVCSRTDPIVIAAGVALALTESDLDDLFTAAAAL